MQVFLSSKATNRL